MWKKGKVKEKVAKKGERERRVKTDRIRKSTVATAMEEVGFLDFWHLLTTEVKKTFNAFTSSQLNLKTEREQTRERESRVTSDFLIRLSVGFRHEIRQDQHLKIITG